MSTQGHLSGACPWPGGCVAIFLCRTDPQRVTLAQSSNTNNKLVCTQAAVAILSLSCLSASLPLSASLCLCPLFSSLESPIKLLISPSLAIGDIDKRPFYFQIICSSKYKERHAFGISKLLKVGLRKKDGVWYTVGTQ